METNSTLTAVVGAFFMLVGVLMIVFHRQAREINEQLWAPFPEQLNLLRPRGRVLTIFIIVFGALSFLGGLTVLIVNSV
jgi:uncharacterized membrane protein HdeD (DUF308 family)